MPYTSQQAYDELEAIGSQVNRGFAQINKMLIDLSECDSVPVAHFHNLILKIAPLIQEEVAMSLIMFDFIKMGKKDVIVNHQLKDYVQEMTAPHEWPAAGPRC